MNIIVKIRWAIDTIRDQLIFGRDELGAAKARELRAKGVLLDVEKYAIDIKVLLDMVQDNSKMPHTHTDPQLRLYCLSERAKELLDKYYPDPKKLY